MASKQQQLTFAQLAAVFAVSSVSVYLWRQGTPTKTALEAPFTPVRVRRWAKENGVPIVKQPQSVLAGKSRPTTTKKPAIRRNAAGKLSGIGAKRAAHSAVRARAA